MRDGACRLGVAQHDQHGAPIRIGSATGTTSSQSASATALDDHGAGEMSTP